MSKSLTEILKARVSPDAFLSKMRSDDTIVSHQAGMQLVAEARNYGINPKDYLMLKIDPKLAAPEDQRRYAGMDGYEATLSYLDLPLRNDYKNAITLQAAAETFQTFPGTRALFPQVIDDVVRWQYHQDPVEQIAPMISGSRTINGNEMLSTVVNDSELTDQIAAEIAEGSRIPVKSIRTSEHAVKIFKHGLGYRTTYEFNRRVAIDILTPYANRAMRELERSKIRRAVGLLVNGDSVYGAAPVVNQSSFDGSVDVASTNGRLAYQNVLAWLVSRAELATPVDTVVGNWDAYFQWARMFSIPVGFGSGTTTGSDVLAKAGFEIAAKPLIGGPIKFALSSAAPAGKLIGFSQGDTMEELVEAGSLISQSEQSMANQTITYYRTENSGYRLVFGDTRSVFNYAA